MYSIRYQFLKFSSKKWFMDHINDPYVKKAQLDNYRSRAAYKLEQIQQKYKIIGNKIIDLGSSPGSWCQVTKKLNPNSKIIAIDLLHMKQIKGVDFYLYNATSQQLHNILKNKYECFDTILSDMAPNFSGDLIETHQNIIQLNKLCIYLSGVLGGQNCHLVMKSVIGQLDVPLYSLIQIIFKQVYRYKPISSRSKSSQFYYICKYRKSISLKNILKINQLVLNKSQTKKYFKQYLKQI